MRHGHFLLYADPGAEDEAVAEERACRAGAGPGFESRVFKISKGVIF